MEFGTVQHKSAFSGSMEGAIDCVAPKPQSRSQVVAIVS